LLNFSDLSKLKAVYFTDNQYIKCKFTEVL